MKSPWAARTDITEVCVPKYRLNDGWLTVILAIKNVAGTLLIHSVILNIPIIINNQGSFEKLVNML